ncbi:NAD-dependent epimerase/dehydratase family protein [bacterium]|nr:NAD-dependent epimerase/dehydratase family protein [bacterium]
MKLLITGVTGFVGRNFLLSALESGQYEAIYLPVRNRAKFEAQLKQDGIPANHPSLRVFEATAGDWKLGDAAQAEHAVHAAGVIFARTREEYWDTNVEGTIRLFRALKNPQKVVVLSSLAAAGPNATALARVERDSSEPVTWYGQSKLEMERRLAGEFAKVPYLLLRPPMIFGPRDQATLPLFKMVRNPVHFKPGYADKYFSVLSVDDLVEAIQTALGHSWSSSGGVYYVAHPHVITDRELLSNAAAVSGRPSRVVWVPQPLLKLASRLIDTIPTWRATIPSLSVDRAKEIWPKRWVVSAAAFERDFGWRAKTSFRQSLEQTRAWYLQTGQI